MTIINIKTNKFEYTLTFNFSPNGDTWSMTSTDTNPNLNFENEPMFSPQIVIGKFKFLMEMRNETIISVI